MAGEPTLKVFVDLGNDGAFDASDEVTPYLASASGVTWDRGRSADFSSDAVGSASFVLMNTGGRFNSNLRPGLPVHIRSNYLGVDRAHFYGFVQLISPDPWAYTLAVTCYDPMRKMGKTDAIIPIPTGAFVSTRELRASVLEDFERGNLNLLSNPAFATDTSDWAAAGGALTRAAATTPTPPNLAWCGNVAAHTPGGNGISSLVNLVPSTYAGEWYSFTAWLRVTSGSASATMSFTDATLVPANAPVACALDTTWRKFTTSFKVAASEPTSSTTALAVQVLLAANLALQITGAAVTRGQGDHAYAAPGSGRFKNFATGSVGGGAALPWFEAFTNMCTNPGFETNTTGWVGLTRITTEHYLGAAAGNIAANATATYNLSGTFLSGVAYTLSVRLKTLDDSLGATTAGLRSSGTPTDTATVSVPNGSDWTEYVAQWTPSSNRSDAQIIIVNPDGGGGPIYVDSVMVIRGFSSNRPRYSDVGPASTGGSFPTSFTTAISANPKFGERDLGMVTAATARSGLTYDLADKTPLFLHSRQYSFSVWVRPSSSFPYRAGVGRNKGDGTWEDSATTGTAAANAWTQISWTWTPASDASAAVSRDVLVYLWQTDTTSRTVEIDGLRVIPGSAPDNFEMSQWSLAQESDICMLQAPLAGTTQSLLTKLNELSGTHHFVRATMSSPWYQYVTTSRQDVAAKTSDESFSDDFRGWAQGDVDQDAVVNIVTISYWSPSWAFYHGGDGATSKQFSDAASVDLYGEQPGAAIDGSAVLYDTGGGTVPDDLGEMLMTRYSVARARPVMEVKERFPSMLARDLGDLLTVTLGRLGISAKKYLLVKASVTVDASGAIWTAKWTLEEYAY